MHTYQASANPNQPINKRALSFGLFSVFLCGIGFSIINPVVPFLVSPYVHSTSQQAFFVTLLSSVYALCLFFASPILGALSDKYGRRPLLLICLLGSAVGYLIFGLGGALWILFAGRIIEGITGGSIGTLFAYFSDILPPEQRTKYFGWVSAFVGAGTIIGPAVGGLLAKFGYAVPMYVGAAVTLLNVCYGYFYMPESLAKDRRSQNLSLKKLNPIHQFSGILSMKTLRILLLSGFLLWIPSGALQAVFSQFTMDAFHWKPVIIGLMFSIMGFQDIFSQSLIMPQLLKKFSDKKIALFGMGGEGLGYLFIALSGIYSFYPLFIVGMFLFGFGDSIFGPSFTGMLSKSASPDEQGRIQGSSQSIQALARMIGPILGGQLYISAGNFAPALMGVLLMIAAAGILKKFKESAFIQEGQ
ncbi:MULTISPECIES: MFS transporter [unclassified Enterococcus]|jgi:DHA1 family tetracycline resistance protein-like MFS transporter|uniref:MFS transporter n=1 Tax=unclassified Enterococcus TaxID=2608891 RepID=UPI003D271EE5